MNPTEAIQSNLRELVKEANDKVRNHEVVLNKDNEIKEFYLQYFNRLNGYYGNLADFMYVCFVDLDKEITKDELEEKLNDEKIY